MCASFLTFWSQQLRQMPFQDMIIFLQALPTANWGDEEIETLLAQAYVLQSMFGGSDAHLRE